MQGEAAEPDLYLIELVAPGEVFDGDQRLVEDLLPRMELVVIDGPRVAAIPAADYALMGLTDGRRVRLLRDRMTAHQEALSLNRERPVRYRTWRALRLRE